MRVGSSRFILAISPHLDPSRRELGACENAGDMEPRPAATVILARPGDVGVEVLILTRGESSRFLPGFAVFPGGTIEPADAELAGRLFGDPSERARACAVRELSEEAGILLTAGGPVARRHDGPLTTFPFEPPDARSLVEIGRWIAPEFLETRFDARFFAVAAPPGLDPVADGLEIAEARWSDPGSVLQAVDRGKTQVIWPTLVTLRALAGCQGVSDVLALRVNQIPHPGVAR
jgi:8-oxo-dGTP pyrophosphatase MutT (NUDIX family)